MTPKEVLEKYSIVDGHAEPRYEIVDVEGNLDRVVYNENGRFAGYLYNTGLSEPGEKRDKIRVFLPDGEYPKIDDLQFLLFKHIIITGEVTVRPDRNPDDDYDSEELQITVKADDGRHDIRVLGDSSSAYRVIVNKDKHPHKRRELPDGPLNIAVIAPRGSKGCNDFACIIDAGVYSCLNYFHPVSFTPGRIKEMIDDIVNKGEYNCLCIVRGGGPPECLAVFDDPGIVKSLKKVRKAMFIVTGIGHSNDLTKCDEVADYCAYTPTDAAYFLNTERNSRF